MSDSMQKYNHKLLAEQSVVNFISYIEQESGEPISEEDRKWLFKKSEEIFDAYYIENQSQVYLNSDEDVENLKKYMQSIQETLGRMYGHIILVEYKLYLLNKVLGI
jgi:hypothetical protein